MKPFNARRICSARVLVLLVTAFSAACATSTPVELSNARTAYSRASAGPAAQWTPADLHKAQAALDQAEQSFREDTDTQRTIDLAYVAERTAQLAEARAQTAIAEKKMATAKGEYGDQQAEISKNAQGALVRTREQLNEAERQTVQQAQQTDQERNARVEADRKAAVSDQRAAAADQKAAASDQNARNATDALAKLAAKEDARGMVITLSGSVLFRTNDAALLPASLVRLNQVAEALVAKGDDVAVEGYTDSRGTRATNIDLSLRRAESVRLYLVSRGFPSEKIHALGMGPDRPVAENSNAEGRANNRRVEIVIAKR